MLNALALPGYREATIARRAIRRGAWRVNEIQEVGILVLAVISLIAVVVLPAFHLAAPEEAKTILAGAIFFYFGRISNAVLVPRPPATPPAPGGAPADHSKGV